MHHSRNVFAVEVQLYSIEFSQVFSDDAVCAAVTFTAEVFLIFCPSHSY